MSLNFSFRIWTSSPLLHFVQFFSKMIYSYLFSAVQYPNSLCYASLITIVVSMLVFYFQPTTEYLIITLNLQFCTSFFFPHKCTGSHSFFFSEFPLCLPILLVGCFLFFFNFSSCFIRSTYIWHLKPFSALYLFKTCL